MPRDTRIMRAIPILIVMIAAAAAGMAWAISSPIGSSPDEDYHLASIWCPPPVETSGCAVHTDATGTTVTEPARAFAAPACYAFKSDQSAACIWNIPADRMQEDGRYDRGEYPGGFYRFMHIFAYGDPYSAVYRIRAFNLGLAIILGALVVLGATRPTRRILAYAVASTVVPMGMFIVPSANPSSWAILGVTITAFALHSFWIAETRARLILNSVLVAAGVALAVASRADASLYVVLTAVAVTALHYKSARRHPLKLVLPGLIAVTGLIAYRMSSQGASALAGSFGPPNTGVSRLSLLMSNIFDSPRVVLGNEGFGELGWLDTPMPAIVYVPMVVVCALLLTAGVRRLSWMKALVAFGGMALVFVIPLYFLEMARLVVGQGIQPRYILPLLPVVSLAVLTGYRADQAVRLPRSTAWIAWGLVTIANSGALMVNIRRYTTGLDGPLWPGHVVEWWSTDRLGPFPTWLLGTISFAVAAWTLVRLSAGRDVPPTVPADVKGILEPALTTGNKPVAADEHQAPEPGLGTEGPKAAQPDLVAGPTTGKAAAGVPVDSPVISDSTAPDASGSVTPGL